MPFTGLPWAGGLEMIIYDNYNDSEQISNIVDVNVNYALHRSLVTVAHKGQRL